MYKTNQLTGNVYNDSEVTIKVKEDTRFCYAKNVFLLGKINNVIVSLRPFGPSLLTEMTHFHTLSYTSASEISTRFYTWSLKKVPLWRRASPCRSLCGLPPGIKSAIRSPFLAPYMTSGMNTLILCTRWPVYRRPFYESSKNWLSSFSSGRFAVYYKIRPYKNTADNKLKKKRFLCLKTLSMSNQFVLV